MWESTMSQPRVAGTGQTCFGNEPKRPGRDLFAEASAAAIDDAGIPRSDVDALYYGNFVGTIAER